MISKNKNVEQVKDDNGYLFVTLLKNGKEYKEYVHELVANSFVPNPNGLKNIKHIDGDKTNNRADNLQWY